MPESYLFDAIKVLLERFSEHNGFVEIPGGTYRPDATAWAAICLDTLKTHQETTRLARSKLRSSQLSDGRISISQEHPEAFWPTFPSVMAFGSHKDSTVAHEKAVKFLLGAVGEKVESVEDDPVGHDGTLAGWPWINHTHAWVEPTAMALGALKSVGMHSHSRTLEGCRLLLDRQLQDGGWNYGNTTIFGQKLNPMIASTGMALWALADMVERPKVSKSIDFLISQFKNIKTPLSLGWALKGLAVWGIQIENVHQSIQSCLEKQHRISPYSTTYIAILLLAAQMHGVEV